VPGLALVEGWKILFVADFLFTKQARQWFSRPGNYDDPFSSGITRTTSYDIRDYFPHREHGSIPITTRSPKLGFPKWLVVKKLDDRRQRPNHLAVMIVMMLVMMI